MRRHDWSGFASLGAAVLTLFELARGSPGWAVAWFVVAIVGALVTRYWSIRYPAPMPHLLRWTLAVPRGNHSPAHLQRILEPQRGESILEIGPGVGIHAIPVASWLAPHGTLDVFDVQQEMLDDVMARARAQGITNIRAKQGDARELPYRNGTFDGAYLVGVLGEIPDEHTALRELRSVLKPNGRLVIGEVFFDPDFVRFSSLKARGGTGLLRVRAEAWRIFLVPGAIPPRRFSRQRHLARRSSPDCRASSPGRHTRLRSAGPHRTDPAPSYGITLRA